jgi:hypothetical protein
MLHRKTLLQQLETFGPLYPVVASTSFLRLFVLTGIAARDVDHELGELGGIAGALAVACHAIIVPPREDLCTVGSEMAISASVQEIPTPEDPSYVTTAGVSYSYTRTHTHRHERFGAWGEAG